MRHKTIISILLCFISLCNSNLTYSQFGCATEIPMNFNSSVCNNSSTAFTNKYRLQEFYNPQNNNYIDSITIPLNIVILGSDTTTCAYTPHTFQQEIQKLTWLNRAFQRTDLPSDPVPGYNQAYWLVEQQNTKIKIEINQVYFYFDSIMFNAPYPNSIYNLRDFHLSQNPNAKNYLNCYLLKNAINVIGAMGQYVPHETYGPSIFSTGWDDPSYPGPWLGKYTYWAHHLPHEIGHFLDLWHTYNVGASETSLTSNIDYLDDVFFNPHEWEKETGCPYIDGVHLPYQSSTDFCTNNLMSGKEDNAFISPLQAGRAHRALRLKNYTRHYAYGYSSIPHEITSNEVWDFAYKSYNNIVVKNGATLIIKCRLEMSSFTKIIVEPGSRLIIDGGIISSARSPGSNPLAFWQGIEVWGTTNQHQHPFSQPTYQGKLELVNGGTIENALLGACNWKPQDYNKIGGVIISNGGVFLNNRQAVEMVTYDNFNQNNPSLKVKNLSSFINTDFTINDNYLGDKSAFLYHVTLWDVFGINFQNCHFTNDITEKIFLGSRNKGIYTIDAGFSVSAGCSILPPIGQGCPNQYLLKSSFTGFHIGIEATGAAVEQAVTVSQSVFDNNIIGIDIESLDNFSVNRNEIAIGNPGYTNYYSSYFGIRSNLSTGFQIEENNIYKYSGTPNTFGISVSSAGIVNNRVYKNRTEGILYGHYYANVNRNPLNQYEGLQFLCNEFDGNSTAVKVNSTLKNNGIRKYQGDYSPNKSAGNIFLNTPVGGLTIDNSTNYGITYYHNGGATFPNNNTSNVTTIQSTNLNSCPSSFGDQPSMMTLQNNIVNLDQQYSDLQYNFLSLLDDGSTPAFIEQIKSAWSSDAWLLRDQLLAQSPYVSQQAILEAISRNILPNAMLLEICLANPDATQDERFIEKLNQTSQTELPQYLFDFIRENWDVKTIRSILESQMGEIAFERNLLINNLLREQLLKNEQSPIEFYEINGQLNGSELKMNQVEFAISLENWTEALLVLENIFANEDLTDEQSIFEDFIEYSNFRASLNDRKLSQLNNSEIQFLENLAEKNNRVGNYSRNILCFFYQICYDNPEELGDTQKISIVKPTVEEILYSLDVYPNPGSNFTSLKWEIYDVLNNCNYIIYDLNGKQMFRNEISKNHGEVTIDTRKLNNGFYSISIQNNGEIKKTIKFIVNNN